MPLSDTLEHPLTGIPRETLRHRLRMQGFEAVTTLAWIYGAYLPKAPVRRYVSKRTKQLAFADIGRSLASEIAQDGFGIDCHDSSGQGSSVRDPVAQ